MNTINTEIKKLSEFDLDILKNKFPDNIYVTSPLFHKWAFNDGESEPLLKNSFEKKTARLLNTFTKNFIPYYKIIIKVPNIDLFYYIFGDDKYNIDELYLRLAKDIYKNYQFPVRRIPVIGNSDFSNKNFFEDSLYFFLKNLYKTHSDYLTTLNPDLTEKNVVNSISKIYGKDNDFKFIPNEFFIEEVLNKSTSFKKEDLLVDMELCKSYKETMEKREKGIPSEPITIKK